MKIAITGSSYVGPVTGPYSGESDSDVTWSETDDYVGKISYVNTGEYLSLQYHQITDIDILECSTPHPEDIACPEDRYTRAEPTPESL